MPDRPDTLVVTNCTNTIPAVTCTGKHHRRRKVWIVLPAFNEERDLPSLLQRIEGAMFEAHLDFEILSDYTCGYRAYRAHVLQQVTQSDPDFFDQDGFQAMVDVLLKLRRNRDLVFGEVPLVLRYDHKAGASKMDIRATTLDTLRLMLRRRFR